MKRRQAGFALLIVLWTLALLALIGSHITATAHAMLTRGAALRAAAQASAAADGAVFQAIFHLLDGPARRWPSDGVARTVRVATGTATVTIEDASGRINPNTAPPALLAALLRRLGADGTRAERVAAGVAEWRDAGAVAGGNAAARYAAAGLPYAPLGERFQTTHELGLVLGMTPDLLARMVPYVSVYTDGRIDPAKASPLVASVLRDAGADRTPPPEETAPRVVEITAIITLPGARAVRRAAVRIDLSDDDAIMPYRILAWE